MRRINRRDFIKNTAVVTAASSFLTVESLAAETKTTVYVVHGKDISKMVQAGIDRLGGWSAFVKKGEKVTIKPNIAWASRPEQGGNTDPTLVGECVAACKAAGASEVIVPENTCNKPKYSFPMSGVEDAVKKAGGKIYAAGDAKYFKKVELPKAKSLKEAEVVKDVLDTGCLINMPVAKSHKAATLTLSMKNWMGSIKDRGFLHGNNLHQCIADISTLIKPSLIIIDATRIMLTNGPRGPGKLDYPNQLIFGTDPVAVDAYAATLFKKEPFDIPHVKIAHEMKIGCGDLARVKVEHIEV
ncbi:DUF362 domain-containing protein [Verrucomicrobiota bacterium]